MTCLTNVCPVFAVRPTSNGEYGSVARRQARADIWAFGCVLYEMLTRKAAFGGETLTDIVLVTNEPDWAELPANTPAAAQALRRHCLQKDLGWRLQHAGDARIEIEEAITEPAPRSKNESRPTARFAQLIPWAVALLALGLLVAQIASRRERVVKRTGREIGTEHAGRCGGRHGEFPQPIDIG